MTRARKTDRDTARPERKPMTGREAKLHAPERPGYKRRYVNDDGSRLQRFQEAGYTFVEDQTATDEAASDGQMKRIRQLVGTKEGGGPLYAYLMEQKEKFYDEDQAAKAAEIADTEAAMFRGEDEQGKPGRDGRYVKTADVSVSTRR